jgi:nitrate/nitrite transporter NarK
MEHKSLFNVPQETCQSLVAVISSLIGFSPRDALSGGKLPPNLSLFPSLTKDNWGLKNFGINYGIVFTAWGVGGFVMGRLSQMLYASSGSYTSSFITAAVLLFAGSLLTLTLKGGKTIEVLRTRKAALAADGR